MNRILFGDNQFFGVNHSSEERARAQAIAFKDDAAILSTLDIALQEGLDTFMCTTHERMITINSMIRCSPEKYKDLKVYPCLPYAHKYANAVAELGIPGTIKQYLPGNFFSTAIKGGMAFISKDHIAMMELLIDAELKMFKGIQTPVIFLQNTITDLLLGLGMSDMLKAFYDHIHKKYDAEAGFITMNMPRLLSVLEDVGIYNPIICTSVNVDGFRMSGGKELYERTLKEKRVRLIAMQILSGGAASVEEAVKYVCALPNVRSILFGASSKAHIRQTVALIRKNDQVIERSNGQISGAKNIFY